MRSLDNEAIRQVIRAAARRLQGDWLVVGGASVALWLDADRRTRDVGIVPFQRGADLLDLYELAADLGLPLETLNAAATLFVHQVEGWTAHAVLVEDGPSARIYRADATLLLLTKLGRLSEQDAADCTAAIHLARAEGLPLDEPRVLGALEELPPATSADVATRRSDLAALLGGESPEPPP